MNTRFLPVLLGSALVLNLISAVPVLAFTDIRSGSQLETYVNDLSAKGIISGYPDGSFRPAQTINRAEALKIIFETIGISADADGNSGFPDVPATEWYAKYVTKAKEGKIVGGYPDGRFRPQQEVNRAEFVKMALSALPNFSELPLRKDPALEQFTDLDAGQWYVPYLGTTVAMELVTRTEKFRPISPMSRQDAVEIIYRVSKYLEDPFVPEIAEDASPTSATTSTFTSPEEAALSEEGAFVIDPTNTSTWWHELPEDQVKVIPRPGMTEIYSYLNRFQIIVPLELRAKAIRSVPNRIEIEKVSDESCNTMINSEKYGQSVQRNAEEYRQYLLDETAAGSTMPELFVWEAPVNRFVPKKNKNGLEYFVFETTLVYSETRDGPKTTEVLKPVYYFFTDNSVHHIGAGCTEVNELLVENFELR